MYEFMCDKKRYEKICLNNQPGVNGEFRKVCLGGDEKLLLRRKNIGIIMVR